MSEFVDYMPKTTFLEFTHTSTKYSVTIDLVDDDVFEDRFEEFRIALFNLSSDVILEPSTAIVRIEDNDGKCVPACSLL